MENKEKEKVTLKVILENVVLGLSALVIVLFIWMVFLRTMVIGQPLVYKDWATAVTKQQLEPRKPFTHVVLRNTYCPNEYVTAKIDCVKKVDEVGYVNWSLYDSQDNLIKSYPERPSGFQETGSKNIVRTVPVEKLPRDLPPGFYMFHGYIRFDMGIKVYDILINTNYFEVKAAANPECGDKGIIK